MTARPDLIHFDRIPAFNNLLDEIRADSAPILLSLPRSVRLPFMAALQEKNRTPMLFISSRPDRLQSMQEEFDFWSSEGHKLIFPEPSPLFYEKTLWDQEIRKERLDTLVSLSCHHIPGLMDQAKPSVIFSSVKSVMTKTLSRRDFILASRTLKVGERYLLDELVRKWVRIGYQPSEIVYAPGQFSRRGGLLDIWPIHSDFPYRLDFFGNDIDTIRRFDPASQRSLEKISTLHIPPARELILPDDQVEDYQNQGISEFEIPLIHSTSSSILGFLPKGSIVLLDNASTLETTADEIEIQALRTRDENINSGILDPQFPSPYISWSEITDELSRFPCIDLGYPIGRKGHSLSDAFLTSPRFGGKPDLFFDYLVDDDHSRNVFVVTKQKERLVEVLNEFPNKEKIKQAIDIFEGSLNSGWRVVYPDGIEDLLMTDSELFGWEIPRPRRRKSAGVEAPELNYADLIPGDWVVHIDYGIGKFGGLVKRYLEGVERDYLLIEYAESDQLYVPVYQADRISTYVGVDQQKPGLTRLGSLQWTTAKTQARHAVKEVAEDLISLYSKRQIVTGYAFSPDTPWQKMLESSFPYIETDDQLEAIIAVKKDMEHPRPMDRLLCGDVGYGKTEVALRAAFKAVMDGKQVGMLVPTTVLAQQHFDTFRSRLAPFPVQVEMLSRFRTPAEQAEVILMLESGDVDIVIGTHRLLQKDVIFKDLGLLIIDEEQRFGVAHKEYFKKFRAEIDVLTLTATPIPRTLYMAISGIRDISIINSPPSDRLPIHTYIGGYEPKLVRQAIMRELDRGGQVFFVHNRVQTINSMAAHISQLVPEARLSIAHGQMPEKELAEVMHRFTSGEVDVLLSTSIIESGLDIPNANTLIVDRGDTFGLAQLYQLRGRVGRGASRAYAYFFHHRKKMPTVDGLERLEIIAENAHLGAGYSIAMRDLEMRGAGNILGTMQHGHIAAVGFHLYTRLLAEAVREINGEASQTNALQDALGVREIKPLVSVELPISVGIPESYIPDEGLRLQLYRRIADITEEDQIHAMKEEFHDRFGPFGEEVDHLFWQYHVKLLAESCGIVSIGIEGNQIAMRFPQLENGIRQRDIPDADPPVRKGKNGYWMPYQKDENWKQNLLHFLKGLAALMKTRM